MEMFADIQSRGHFSPNSTLVQAHTASLLPSHPRATGLDYYQDPAYKLVALDVRAVLGLFWGCKQSQGDRRVFADYTHVAMA